MVTVPLLHVFRDGHYCMVMKYNEKEPAARISPADVSAQIYQEGDGSHRRSVTLGRMNFCDQEKECFVSGKFDH